MIFYLMLYQAFSVDISFLNLALATAFNIHSNIPMNEKPTNIPKFPPDLFALSTGHWVVMVKRHLVLFGGFLDSFSGDHTKYFNNVSVFDTDTRVWKKIEANLKSQVAKG